MTTSSNSWINVSKRKSITAIVSARIAETVWAIILDEILGWELSARRGTKTPLKHFICSFANKPTSETTWFLNDVNKKDCIDYGNLGVNGYSRC